MSDSGSKFRQQAQVMAQVRFIYLWSLYVTIISPHCQIQGEKMKSQLQDMSILKNNFFGMTEISY